MGISWYHSSTCCAETNIVPGDCTRGIPFGPTVAMLPRNDMFVRFPPFLSFRVKRSEIEESSGLTMVHTRHVKDAGPYGISSIISVGEGLDPPFFASIRRGEQKVNCPKGKRGHPGVLLVRAVRFYEFAEI